MKFAISLLLFCKILGLINSDCNFGLTNYSTFDTLKSEFPCIEIQCIDNNWQTSNEIDINCKSCFIDQQYIGTFDLAKDQEGDYSFRWSKMCRYSLVERVPNWSDGKYNPQPPEFGIYADYQKGDRSSDALPFFVTKVSYEFSPLLKLNVDYSNNFKIMSPFGIIEVTSTNPEPVIIGGVKYPAFAWDHENCLRLLGPHLLIEICKEINNITLWMNVNYSDKIGGLCGNFNGNEADDQRGRDGTFSAPQDTNPEFAKSWTTYYQSTPVCYVEKYLGFLPIIGK